MSFSKMYKQRLSLGILVLVCTLQNAFSQINVSVTSGCMPGGITNAVFSYVGTGNPTNVLWNFGDNTTSTITPAQHSYLSQGTFNIVFTAMVGSSSVTYTAQAIVHPQPSGSSFSPPTIPASHCVGMSAGFSGSSALPNAIYNWDFGDNVLGIGNPISHSYGNAGNFTPILTVEDPVTHCYANVTGPVIHVSNLPYIAVTANPGTTTCSTTFNTSFDASGSTSGSPLGPTLTYVWNIGSGSTSSNSGPLVYTAAGIYHGTLTVTDDNNCSNSVPLTVSLVSPTVNAIVPPTVCISQQTPQTPIFPYFTATVVSNQPTTVWDMGDGTQLNFPPPAIPPSITPTLTPNVPYSNTIHTYFTPGPKTVSITASAGGCSQTITRTIFVEQITPTFVATPPAFTCSPTFSVSYTNQTNVNTASTLSYTWDVVHWNGQFGHYTTTATHPTVLVHQESLNPYTIYSPHYGITANLRVVSSLGCHTVQTLTFDSIRRPTALFQTSPTEGCVPLAVTFTNISQTNEVIYPITSYTWDFGASPSSTLAGTGSVIPVSSFNYTNPGTYYATLSISTASGCGHTSYAHTITVTNPPAFNYTLPTTACAGQPVTINLAASSSTIQHWHIESDQGYFSSCVSDSNPTWNFTHVGPQSFTISAYSFGCKSTSVSSQQVNVLGPIGKARYETNCGSGTKKDIKFYYGLSDVTGGTLDFGDTSPPLNITLSSPGYTSGTTVHTYTGSGEYIAILTSYNGLNNCPVYRDTIHVSVSDLQADFTLDTVICKDAWLHLNASTSIGVDTNDSRGYYWLVDSYAPHWMGNPTYICTDPLTTIGMHQVKLVIRNKNGCSDTMTKNFRVSFPTPDFTFNSNPICYSNMPAHMIDLTPQSPDAVTNYTWSMGDSAYHVPHVHTYITGTTAAHSPTFAFTLYNNAQSQTYSVVLTVKNSHGCINTKRHDITVNNPVIVMGANPLHACFPSPLSFDVLAGNTHSLYVVDFGDGNPFTTTAFNTNTLYAFNHYFAAPGVYTPTVTLTDNAGCTTSVVLPSSYVQLVPVATFTYYNILDPANTSSVFCMPVKLKLTSTSQYTPSLFYIWDTDNGAGPILASYTAVATPVVTGPRSITLTVQTFPAGCTSTKVETIRVYDPHIDFELVPKNDSLFCIGEAITVSVTSRNGSGIWIWDFGDSHINTPISQDIYRQQTYQYDPGFFPEPNGDLSILVTGYGDNDVRFCKETKQKKIKIIRVLPEFNRGSESLLTDSVHCLLDKIDQFINKSTSNSSTALTYTWDVGDGATYFGLDANELYQNAGVYTIKLTALEEKNGCAAVTIKHVTINPLPSAQLTVAPLSCPNTPFIINGSASPGVSGIVTGYLTPSTNVTPDFNPSNSFSIQASAPYTTIYVLHVIDNNGCRANSREEVAKIQEPPPIVHWDTTVVIGQTVPLNAFVGSNFTYTWAPLVDYLNCDTCLFYNPISNSTVNVTYSVNVEDTLKCSVVQSTYKITIEPVVSLDVPTAFTPNGDGVNDVIYPAGWGLRKLVYFKVFNRWGQLLFESNDLKTGWNGIYNGVPQNMETYVYQVSAETYLDREPVLTKTGTFKLLR
jgi:gliding motility-associated-like protein